MLKILKGRDSTQMCSDNKKSEQAFIACSDLARPEGFEPATFWFVAKHSIQLSYSRNSFPQGALP